MIHQQIISILRKESKDQPNKKVASLLSLSDDDMIRRMFLNYRITDDGPKGLRLSSEGHIILSSYFSSFRMNLDIPLVKPYQMLFLDKVTTMPWHLNSRALTFYEEEIAVRFRLCGDLDNFINLSQDLLQKS